MSASSVRLERDRCCTEVHSPISAAGSDSQRTPWIELGQRNNQRLNPLFHASLKMDPQDRASFIDEACGDDLEQRIHLKQLIEAEEQGTRTIDAPLVDLN